MATSTKANRSLCRLVDLALERGIGGGFSSDTIGLAIADVFSIEDPSELRLSSFDLYAKKLLIMLNARLIRYGDENIMVTYVIMGKKRELRGLILPVTQAAGGTRTR